MANELRADGLNPMESKRKVVLGMSTERYCLWIFRPADARLTLSPAKWWFALSRSVFAKHHRLRTSRMRPPVGCFLTPTFVSPLARRPR